jgi:hypothetical protein
MTTYSGLSQLDLMKQYQNNLDANVQTRKMYMGGNPVPQFKQQEYSQSAYELELSQQRLQLLQKGGLKKKTKRKYKNRKQKIRHVHVRVNSYKRGNTRKKNNK